MCIKFHAKQSWSRLFYRSRNFFTCGPFLQTNLMTPHVFLSAPEKWPWSCWFGLKFNWHVSYINLRLNVETFFSNRLDCRDKWRFHNVCKFPFSCSPSCHPFWRNFSVIIWSGEYFRSVVTSTCVRVLVNFSFTYRWTFSFNKNRTCDILI